MKPIDYVPYLISLTSVVIALITLVRAYHKDDNSEKEGILKANLKLDGLCTNIQEIRLDTKSTLQRVEKIETSQAVLNQKIADLASRVETLERKTE